jgi:hypothetical protein
VIALALCIATGTQLVALPAHSFTLQWQHTVEKVLWEEDYLVAGDWLYLSGARVRGSGAGMEPPAGSALVGGAWHYRPALRWHRKLELARSTVGDDYRLCIEGRCRPLENWVARGPTTIAPCPAAPAG